MSYQFYPQNLLLSNPCDDKYQKIQIKTSATNLKQDLTNSYFSNKSLGDEFSYVLERKNQTRYTGNTLDQPKILLKGNKVREVGMDEEVVNQGGDFQDFNECEILQDNYQLGDISGSQQGILGGAKVQAGDMQSRYQGPTSQTSSNNKIQSHFGFLQHSGLIMSNLYLNENSEIIVQNDNLKIFTGFQLVVSSKHNQYIYPIRQTVSPTVLTKDLTQKLKNNEKFFSIFRNNNVIRKGESYEIQDITSIEYSVVDNISKVYEIQLKHLKYRGTSASSKGKDFGNRWEFLKTWNTLSVDDKLLKFNEHTSHELNFYIYMKDKEFFENVVKVFIANKLEKDVVDYVLLGLYKEVCIYYGNFENQSKLNLFEQCLVIFCLKQIGNDKEAENFAKYIENQNKLGKYDLTTYKKLFDIVLNSVEEEDKQGGAGGGLGIRNVVMQQQQQYTQQAFNPQMVQQKQQMMQYQQQQQQYQQQGVAQGGGFSPQYMSKEKLFGTFSSMLQTVQQNAQMDLLCNFDNNFGNSNNNNINTTCDQFSSREDALMKKRGAFKAPSKNIGTVSEYCERQYYESIDNKPVHLHVNQFWVDFSKYISQSGKMDKFLSASFIYLNKNHTELVLAMSLLDLPYKKPTHEYNNKGGKDMTILAGSDYLIFTKQLKEANPDLRQDIMINQRFFDPKDKYEYDEDDSSIYYEKEANEFLVNKIYGSQVIVTNCTCSQQELQILTEVPEGSIPILQNDYTKVTTVKIGSYSTHKIEYFFYFPSIGSFGINPSNAAKDGQVYGVAKAKKFTVKLERNVESSVNFSDLLIKGDNKEILKFIEQKNIQNSKIFEFGQIYYLLNDKDFYLQLVEIMKERRIYDNTVFSFSIYHGDEKSYFDFMNFENQHNIISKYISYIDSKLLKIKSDNLIRFNPLRLFEYYPLITPRVHGLKQNESNIQCRELRITYLKFLEYLIEKGQNQINVTDKIVLTYYTILQERVKEAITIFQSIKRPTTDNEGVLQYDYMAAYLDFYQSQNFTVARDIVDKYLNYPIISWRNLFFEMANQLAEYDGEAIEDDNLIEKLEKDASKQNKVNSEKEEYLEVKVEGKKFIIQHQNLNYSKKVSISYYFIDLEVFFSKKPFLSKMEKDFDFLMPNHSEEIQLNEVKQNTYAESVLQLPGKVQNKNLFIQVSTGSKKVGATYFSTSLKVQLIENYGILKVTDQEDRPISKVYVKTFSKDNQGDIKFFKDGYTDLRGKYNYMLINQKGSQNIKKFAIFVMSDELGSLITEGKVSSSIGRFEDDEVKLKSKNYQNIQMNQAQNNIQKWKKC